jgi:hypothetical protein
MEQDWRLPHAYSYVVDPSAFSWEFLRRNPDYQADYRSITSEQEAALVANRWGCALDPILRSDHLLHDSLSTLNQIEHSPSHDPDGTGWAPKYDPDQFIRRMNGLSLENSSSPGFADPPSQSSPSRKLL